jgi:hypothetical protein
MGEEKDFLSGFDDHIFIETKSGKRVVATSQGEILNPGEVSFDAFDTEEVRSKLADMKMDAMEKEIFGKIRKDKDFEEIRDIWTFEREPEDLEKLDSDPEYLIQEFYKKKATMEKSEEEKEEAARKEEKAKKLHEKKMKILAEEAKQKVEMGHSTDDQVMEWLIANNIIPDKQ